MAEFNVRSDSVNVEQIMEEIRARVREKRGVDYTEQQISELATVKLEKFLDARGVRSDLLDQYKRVQADQPQPAPASFAFEADTLYASHRAPLRWIRRLLQPVLKLFFNPNSLIQALHIQANLNAKYSARLALEPLHFEVLHNLVLETTRLGIEVKNLKMRVESLTSRLEFNERRARALERVVVYAPDEERQQEEAPRTRIAPPMREADPAGTVPSAVEASQPAEGPGQRSRRRRRRRGRRGGTPAAALMGGPGAETAPDGAHEPQAKHAESHSDVDGGTDRVSGVEGRGADRATGDPPATSRLDPDQQ